jgi:hypothetical protein
MSGSKVQRLIKLTKLKPKLIDLVATKKLTLEIGGRLADIPAGKQDLLVSAIGSEEKTPKITTDIVETLVALSKSDNWRTETIRDALDMSSPSPKPKAFKLTEKEISAWFPEDYSGDARAKIVFIEQLVREYFERRHGYVSPPVIS